MKIAIKDIKNSPYQVRDVTPESDPDLLSLADSVRMHGQLQAIKVRPLEDGRFECVFGHRRLRAMELAGFEEVDVSIDSDITDEEAQIQNLIENLQRKDLSIPEKGDAVINLMVAHPASFPTIKSVAETLGVSKDYASGWIRAADFLSSYARSIAHKLSAETIGSLRLYSKERQDEILEVFEEDNFESKRVQAAFFRLFNQYPEKSLSELYVQAKQEKKNTIKIDISKLSKETQKEIQKIEQIPKHIPKRVPGIGPTTADIIEKRRQEAIASGAAPDIDLEKIIKQSQQVVTETQLGTALQEAEKKKPRKEAMTPKDYLFQLETATSRVRKFLTAGRQVEIWESPNWPMIEQLLTSLVNTVNKFIEEAEHAQEKRGTSPTRESIAALPARGVRNS